MPTDHEDFSLRFHAGKYEENVLDVIVFLQFILGGMVAILAFGWVYFTLSAWLDSNRSATFLFGAIPVLFAMGAAVYLLNLLYEKA